MMPGAGSGFFGTPAESGRGARVVEWAGLENRCTGNRTVGSNPTLSASDHQGLRPRLLRRSFLWRVPRRRHKGRQIMDRVIVSDHPLVQHKLSILRDRQTNVRDFRELCAELSMLLAFEAMRNLPLEDARIETPVATADVK